MKLHILCISLGMLLLAIVHPLKAAQEAIAYTCKLPAQVRDLGSDVFLLQPRTVTPNPNRVIAKRSYFIGDYPPAAPAGPDFIKTGIYLKNNSFLPKKITLISYGPFQSGHTTEVVTLLPGQKIRRKYLLGTKLYLADEDQLAELQKGGSIDEQDPFLLIRVRDKDTIFKLFEEKSERPHRSGNVFKQT